MKDKQTNRKTIKTVKIKSKNGVDLTVEHYFSKEKYDHGREYYTVYKTASGYNDGYINSVDNGIGKWYSMSFGEIKSFDKFCKLWKNRYVFDMLGEGVHSNEKTYQVDLYRGKDVSKEDFDSLMKNIKFLLDKGCEVDYNDEHGVGEFVKKGKKYKAAHHRYGSTSYETLTIDGIAEFLRSFFDLGYKYEQQDTWI